MKIKWLFEVPPAVFSFFCLVFVFLISFDLFFKSLFRLFIFLAVFFLFLDVVFYFLRKPSFTKLIVRRFKVAILKGNFNLHIETIKRILIFGLLGGIFWIIRFTSELSGKYYNLVTIFTWLAFICWFFTAIYLVGLVIDILFGLYGKPRKYHPPIIYVCCLILAVGFIYSGIFTWPKSCEWSLEGDRYRCLVSPSWQEYKEVILSPGDTLVFEKIRQKVFLAYGNSYDVEKGRLGSRELYPTKLPAKQILSAVYFANFNPLLFKSAKDSTYVDLVVYHSSSLLNIPLLVSLFLFFTASYSIYLAYYYFIKRQQILGLGKIRGDRMVKKSEFSVKKDGEIVLPESYTTGGIRDFLVKYRDDSRMIIKFADTFRTRWNRRQDINILKTAIKEVVTYKNLATELLHITELSLKQEKLKRDKSRVEKAGEVEDRKLDLELVKIDRQIKEEEAKMHELEKKPEPEKPEKTIQEKATKSLIDDVEISKVKTKSLAKKIVYVEKQSKFFNKHFPDKPELVEELMNELKRRVYEEN